MIAFFDTCALIPKYIEGKHSYRVRTVVSKRHSPIYISEMSVVETISAFGSHCRDKHLSHGDFVRFKSQFEDDIADGLIEIVPLSTVHMYRAQLLLEFAGVEQGHHIKTQDALIAVSCLDHARTLDRRLTFYTKDWRLYKCMYGVNAYRSALRLRFLGKGTAAVPSSAG